MIPQPLSRAVSTLAVVMCALPPAFAANQSKQQVELQKEGIELMGQVLEAARDIRYNADRLSMLSKSLTISKWTHYHHLMEIKSLVNEGLQPAFQRLSEIRPQLPEWKQQSIDNMMEAAKALAADANSAILSKKEAGPMPSPLNAEYKTLISNVYQHADSLVKTAETAREYAKTKLKAEQGG